MPEIPTQDLTKVFTESRLDWQPKCHHCQIVLHHSVCVAGWLAKTLYGVAPLSVELSFVFETVRSRS